MGKGKGKKGDKRSGKSGAQTDADALESKEKADEERKVAEVAEEMVADGVHPLGGFSDALRVEKGFVLADVDTSSTPAFAGDKIDGKAALESSEEELADLLEWLWAESTAGSRRSLLLVVQGMDTSGKGGIMRHVLSVNPQGVKATALPSTVTSSRIRSILIAPTVRTSFSFAAWSSARRRRSAFTRPISSAAENGFVT